jgi:hypothetical protein
MLAICTCGFCLSASWTASRRVNLIEELSSLHETEVPPSRIIRKEQSVALRIMIFSMITNLSHDIMGAGESKNTHLEDGLLTH